MSKTFMGVRLRRLREERNLTQTAVAQALGISNSYLSQIEQNQRPLTVPLLLKLNAAFGVDHVWPMPLAPAVHPVSPVVPSLITVAPVIGSPQVT